MPWPDLVISPIPIPVQFRAVRYDGSRHPGVEGGLELGANCQKFAYEFTRHYGCVIPDFRSSELWADTASTRAVETFAALKPLDLLLFHEKPDAWGAHVGVYLGQDLVLHLSKQVGRPAIWHFTQFASRPGYAFYIGAKRTLTNQGAPPDE
jgi:cell wall-associated NlpC family hydrolase